MALYSISRTNQAAIKRMAKDGYSVEPVIGKRIACSIWQKEPFEKFDSYDLLCDEVVGATLNEAIENAIKAAGL